VSTKKNSLAKLARKCHCSEPVIAPYAHGLRLDVYTSIGRDGTRVKVLRGLTPLQLSREMLAWARTVRKETIGDTATDDCDAFDCPEPEGLANVG
jgi:hypothetical protein